MSDILICAPAEAAKDSPWLDNETGPCSDCGAGLVWRRHMSWVPRKLCYHCGIRAIEDEPEPVTIRLTKKTKQELAEWRLREQRRHQP